MMAELLTTFIILMMAGALVYFSRLYFKALTQLRDAKIAFATELITNEMLAERLTVVTNERDVARAHLNQSFEEIFALRRALDLSQSQISVAVSPPMLDEQTKSLVRLATSNPNEHERHAAAIVVCKRLREKLNE